jgi:hypothetical protein
MTDGEKAEELSRKLREAGYELRIYPTTETVTDLEEFACTIIANVRWEDMPDDWLIAAKAWRDLYHAKLASKPNPARAENAMTNEYQPLDPKEWLADPEGWELEYLFNDGAWCKPPFGPVLSNTGVLIDAHRWRMRRKAKPVVMYFRVLNGEFHYFWIDYYERATHIVTFGPDDESSSCRRVK